LPVICDVVDSVASDEVVISPDVRIEVMIPPDSCNGGGSIVLDVVSVPSPESCEEGDSDTSNVLLGASDVSVWAV
jgi:hypothetical protein